MSRILAFAALLLCAVPAYSQTRQQVEARLAQLSPAERAYERFRYWITMQPAGSVQGSDVEAKYRGYLKEQGFSAADIDQQLQIVNDRSAELEKQRWNRILTSDSPSFNTKPNSFLVEMAKDRHPGAALDVGMGQGRNSIWLAQQRWDVTGFDPADQAVALARKTALGLGLRLNTEIATSEKFDFGENRWDLILFSYAGVRESASQVMRGLKAHGVVIIEGFHRDATKGRSIGGAVVFDSGDLIRLFPNLRVVRYEEPLAVADFGQERVRVVRYCAEKPE